MDHELREEADVEALQATVLAGIRSADPPAVPQRDYQPLAIALRAPSGEVVGGVHGATMWQWLMIDGVWVAADPRGQGLGRRLVLAAEAAAIARGCRGAWLGTFDFQARGFYERLGYTVFGELPGFPPGHTHFELRKQFAESASARGG